MREPLEATRQSTTVPTVIWRGVMFCLSAVAAGGVSWMILACDAHNDRRYLRLESYQNDPNRDKELRDVLTAFTNARCAEQDRTLAEIKADVKRLLNERRGGAQ